MNTMDDVEFTYEDPNTSGDTLSVMTRNGDLFDFEIDEPWAGCTESGFGQRCDISLPREMAVLLAQWILDRAGVPEPAEPEVAGEAAPSLAGSGRDQS